MHARFVSTRTIHHAVWLVTAVSALGGEPARATTAEDAKPATRADCAATTAARDPSVMRLIDGLNGGEPSERKTAAQALADLGAPAAKLSRCLLSDRDPALRAAGARALGAIANADAVEPLIVALGDASPEVKEEAAKALGALRSAKAVEALIVALKDTQLGVRVQAAAALGLIRDPRAVAPLMTVLGEKTVYDEGRIGARVLFAEDSGAQVGAVLDSAYKMLGLDLSHTAAAALEALTGEKLGSEPAKWQEWLRKRTGKG